MKAGLWLPHMPKDWGGMGLGHVALAMVQVILSEHIAAGRLVPVLAEWSAARLPLYVMYPRNRHLSARVRAFVDWVVELYRAKFEQLESESP